MALCDGYYKVVIINQYGKKQIHQYNLDAKFYEKIPILMKKQNSNMVIIYKIKKNQSIDLDIVNLL
jgi:hypothetical protein|tara:strand:+ start:495 stop:692 length:198 start_codon:yes stop_codon:yes gene_type:complete